MQIMHKQNFTNPTEAALERRGEERRRGEEEKEQKAEERRRGEEEEDRRGEERRGWQSCRAKPYFRHGSGME